MAEIKLDRKLVENLFFFLEEIVLHQRMNTMTSDEFARSMIALKNALNKSL